jgi:hypothetical protein
MRNILGIASKLIGRYGGLTGITWFEGVGKKNKFLTCWIYIFGLSSPEKSPPLLQLMHMFPHTRSHKHA